ncbi:MAG: phosphoribosyltransferase [Desulfurococcaceae archaeon]
MVRRVKSIVLRAYREDEISEMIDHINKAFGSTKYSRMKARLLAVEVLRLLKPTLPYKILSRITGIQESVLCRYVRGNIIPNYEQAINLLANITLSVDYDYLLRQLVEEEGSNIIDLSRVLKDPYVIRLLSIILMLKLLDKDITKILATAESIVPLATLLGVELNIPVISIKKKAYPGVQYYQAIIPRSPKDTEVLYIDRDMINRKDKLLLLVDVVYTGRTLESIISMIDKSKAQISSIIIILALSDVWKTKFKEYNVTTLTRLPYPF